MTRLISRPRAAARAILVSAIAGLTACTKSPAAAPEMAVRDSAGVVIVENGPDAEDRAPRWEVAREPRLRIGAVEGAAEYLLSGVRGALTLGDEVVVLNAGSNELRFYDRRGNHLRSVGRQGSGPGEFQAAEWLFLVGGDSLAVYDMVGGFSLFGRDGEFTRVVRSPVPRPPVGFIRPGLVVLDRSNLAIGLDSPELVVRNHSTLLAADLESGEVHTLIDSVPGRLLLQSTAGGQPSFTPVPFSEGSTFRIGHGRIYIVDHLRPEIRIHDGGGQLERVIRVLRDPEPVPSEAFARVVEERISAGRDPAMQTELRRRYGRMPIPEARPSYSDLLVTEDELWLRRFQEDASSYSHWSVFSLDGSVVGIVRLPPRFTPTEIGADHVLGIRRDELGVQYVEEYALVRT